MLCIYLTFVGPCFLFTDRDADETCGVKCDSIDRVLPTYSIVRQFHARTMLEQLSGRVHEVLTGVAVFDGVSCRSLCVISKVHFRAISNDEINAYWDSGEPLGKAGGYAIQGLGGIFVQRIEGSYSAIVGLPIAQTEALLVGSGLDTWGGRACLKNS